MQGKESRYTNEKKNSKKGNMNYKFFIISASFLSCYLVSLVMLLVVVKEERCGDDKKEDRKGEKSDVLELLLPLFTVH